MTTDFVIDVTDSAVEGNEAAAEYREETGTPVCLDSRAEAEALVGRLNRAGPAEVRLQRAAPQEPRDVDAYLVCIGRGDPGEPVESGDGRWTFDVRANQYGALGEALVLAFSRNPPPLMPYVREDLTEHLPTGPDVPFDGVDEFDLRVELDREPPVVTHEADGEHLTWRPDCVAEARVGDTGTRLRRYWCEIKTGDASFERDQARVMRSKAETDPVLTVRFDVDELPTRYDVRVEAVES